jgi:hypothetical protein
MTHASGPPLGGGSTKPLKENQHKQKLAGDAKPITKNVIILIQFDKKSQPNNCIILKLRKCYLPFNIYEILKC